MSKHPKRAREQVSSSSESDNDIRLQERSDDEDCSDIDVDFQFDSFCDEDFHGVSLLLKNVLGGEFDNVGLTDCLLEQQNISCAVKTGDDSAICAIGSVVNPHQYKDVEGVKQLKGYILRNANKSASEAVAKSIQRILAEPASGIVPGIVLKERLVNLPLQIAPGIHKVLIDDIAWSLSPEAECPPDEAQFYRFTHFAFLSYFLVDPAARGGGKLVSAGKTKKAKKTNAVSEADRIYMHVEDETFLESSTASFSWREGEHDDGKNKYEKHRLVYVMEKADYSNATERLTKAV